jgi:hypothetical protein
VPSPTKFAKVDQFAVQALRNVGKLDQKWLLDCTKHEALRLDGGVVLIRIVRAKAVENNNRRFFDDAELDFAQELEFSTHIYRVACNFREKLSPISARRVKVDVIVKLRSPDREPVPPYSAPVGRLFAARRRMLRLNAVIAVLVHRTSTQARPRGPAFSSFSPSIPSGNGTP